MTSLLALHTAAVFSRAEEARLLDATYGTCDRETAHAAFIAAANAAEVALAALIAALAAAEWGPQTDGSFVTRTSPVASTRETHTLHAPGRQGPLAAVKDWERGGGASLVVLRTRAEAITLREEERRASRAAHAAGVEARAAVDAAVASGAWVYYRPGQEGGTLQQKGPTTDASGWTVDSGSAPVSARGACRRAHVDVSQLPEWAGWIRFGEPLEPQGQRVTLRALPARVRRLPAAQRAQSDVG